MCMYTLLSNASKRGFISVVKYEYSRLTYHRQCFHYHCRCSSTSISSNSRSSGGGAVSGKMFLARLRHLIDCAIVINAGKQFDGAVKYDRVSKALGFYIQINITGSRTCWRCFTLYVVQTAAARHVMNVIPHLYPIPTIPSPFPPNPQSILYPIPCITCSIPTHTRWFSVKNYNLVITLYC